MAAPKWERSSRSCETPFHLKMKPWRAPKLGRFPGNKLVEWNSFFMLGANLQSKNNITPKFVQTWFLTAEVLRFISCWLYARWCLGKWATGCFYDMLDFVVLPLSTGDAAITSKQLHRVLRGAPIQSGAGKHRWNQHHQDLTNTKQMWWFFVQGIPKLCCETNSKQMWWFFVQGIPKLCCETNTKQMWWFFSTSNVINLL